jgi:lipopolysaccharide/colanic/teichoic acid biosynthesis glycosyltransferase
VTTPTSNTRSEDARQRRHLFRAAAAIIGFVLAAVGLALLARLLQDGLAPARIAVGLAATAALTGLAAFSLQWAMASSTGHSPSSFYRLAFTISVVVAAVSLASQGPNRWLACLVTFSALGAFAGALAASWRDEGIWEDNSPPPPEAIRFVLEAHRARHPGEMRMPAGKRLLDAAASATGLILTSPLALLVCFLLWLDDPGPLFFVKNSVGAGGRNFRQWKLRTMVRGAEAESGPVWSERADQRVLRVGAVLRKTALDELPQLVNILSGQMSLVGPRPQRTVLVAEYLHPLPGYADRHRLPPGLAGLAQVAGHYYITPRQKLRFDRLYLEHAGLGFDLRLILIAFAVVFWLRWRPGWRGRLPRAWLHGRRRARARSA